MRFLRNFSRIFVGLIFIFSGFVKGVDPIGTAYRIDDYFIAYGTEWALPLALFLSIFLCTLEFILGLVLVFNIRLKFFSLILFPLMIFFTFLTFYDALYEPVPDCGCFGDAITLSNWDTFYKNIVLIFFVSIIFMKRKKFKSPWGDSWQNILAVFFVTLFAGFSIFNYYHLPLLDFREWKEGTNMVPEETGQVKIYLTYQNKNTGETKEYLSPNYPWSDSAWMSDWEFVEQRIDDSELIKAHELVIETEEGDDVTDVFIANPDYQFIMVAWDLEKSSEYGLKKINELYKQADIDGYSMILVTSSLPEIVMQVEGQLDPFLEVYFADDVVLKTMIRANPGLMLFKDGYIVKKWHYNNITDYTDIKNKYLTK